jgi:hypothetical protein
VRATTKNEKNIKEKLSLRFLMKAFAPAEKKDKNFN